MHLPAPRGLLSERVAAILRDRASVASADRATPRAPNAGSDLGDPDPLGTDFSGTDLSGLDLIEDGDFQLALWMLFELHYRGFDDVDPDLEWDPVVLQIRGQLERRFEESLRELTAIDVRRAKHVRGDFVSRLSELIATTDGGSLAAYLQRRASEDQFGDFMRQRSIYHLKESDPQSFVLPRLDGAAKVALAELQYDEYGAGRPEQLHATLFADALRAMGIDASYGALIDEASASTLAVNNAMSMFSLRRRLRGASLGHLAAFEATSSLPCRRIVAGIERLGLPTAVATYFDEHVEADAVHEQLAIHDICGALVEGEPELADDVLFGAASCLRLDQIAAQALIDSWESLPGARGREVTA